MLGEIFSTSILVFSIIFFQKKTQNPPKKQLKLTAKKEVTLAMQKNIVPKGVPAPPPPPSFLRHPPLDPACPPF